MLTAPSTYLEHFANSVEEPSVRVDLLLVLRLDDKNDLYRHQVVGVICVRHDQLRCGINRQLGRVLLGRQRLSQNRRRLAYLENVRDSVLSVDLFLHDTILIHTDSGQNIQHSLVHGLETVNDECHGDLLPSRHALLRRPAPILGLLGLADVSNVQHHTVQRASVERLVLVIGGDRDEQLGLPVVHLRAQTVAGGLGEVIWVTGSRRVAHVPVRILGSSARQVKRRCSREFGSVAVLPLGLDGRKYRTWDRVFRDEVTLRQLDLARHTTLDCLAAPPLRLYTRRGGGSHRNRATPIRVTVRVRVELPTHEILSSGCGVTADAVGDSRRRVQRPCASVERSLLLLLIVVLVQGPKLVGEGHYAL